MTLPKKHIKFPLTDPKEMEIYKLLCKTFRITVLKELSKF